MTQLIFNSCLENNDMCKLMLNGYSLEDLENIIILSVTKSNDFSIGKHTANNIDGLIINYRINRVLKDAVNKEYVFIDIDSID